jgi:hypothetical protein
MEKSSVIEPPLERTTPHRPSLARMTDPATKVVVTTPKTPTAADAAPERLATLAPVTSAGVKVPLAADVAPASVAHRTA